MKRKIFLFLSILFLIMAIPHIVIFGFYIDGKQSLSTFQLLYIILMIVFGISLFVSFLALWYSEWNKKEE